MSTDLVPLADMQTMAEAIAKSRLFGVKTPEEALSIMLLAQAEGMHPAAAARDYHIIQGRPAMKADAMMARYIASGGKVEWNEYTDAKVVGTFSHPAGGSVKIEWTLDMAKRIGLATKDNWKNYPRQMLRARVISEGVRTTNPAVAVGIYTVEEVQDFEPRKEKDMGAAEVLPAAGKGVDVVRGDLVTKPQLTRLEATITAMRFEREEVRAWCKAQFGKLHFGQLDKAEYQKLDAAILAGTFKERPAPADAEDIKEDELGKPASEYVTPDQALTLEALCTELNLTDAFKKRAGVDRFAIVLAAEYEDWHAWLHRQGKLMREKST